MGPKVLSPGDAMHFVNIMFTITRRVGHAVYGFGRPTIRVSWCNGVRNDVFRKPLSNLLPQLTTTLYVNGSVQDSGIPSVYYR